MKFNVLVAAITVTSSTALVGWSSVQNVSGGVMNGLADAVGSVPVVNEMSGVNDYLAVRDQMDHVKVLQAIVTPDRIMDDGSIAVPATVVSVEIIEIEAADAITLSAYAEKAESLGQAYGKYATVVDPVGYTGQAGQIGDAVQAVKLGSAVFDAFGDNEVIETHKYVLKTAEGMVFEVEQPADIDASFGVGDNITYRSMAAQEAEANLFFVDAGV